MMSASRKRGIVMPRNEMIDSTVSTQVYWRTAARMPKPMPKNDARIWQVSAMAMVAGRRCMTTSATGLL